MKRIYISLSLLLATGISMLANDAQTDRPLWLRNTAISPDGQTIAFTYKGDIFTVPVAGGRATQITTNPAYDSCPLWSPDGRSIAFASVRDGATNIYLISAQGGTAKRLTTHTSGQTPLAFVDNEHIAYSTSLPPSSETITPAILPSVYVVDTSGKGRPRIYSSIPMGALSVNPGNGAVLYQDRKGYEDVLRKHERSSVPADIWMLKDGKYQQITTFNGHDLNPVWDSKNNGFYYLSEKDGNLNIYYYDLSDNTERQITSLKHHPVRNLSVSNNNTLAFSYDGEIYVLDPARSSTPQRLDITIVTDDYDADTNKSVRKSGATNISPSKNGEDVAFVMRGDVYVTGDKYKTTKRITNTDGQERCISMSPDGRSVVYDSERDGKWRIYRTTIVNPDEKSLTYASEIKEELLIDEPQSVQQPEYSPDGKKIAFLRNRTELCVYDIESKKITTALDGKYNYSYTDGDISFAWSPDSRRLLVDYIGVGGWNNTDIAVVNIDGTELVDLTESGYSDSNAKWVLGGKAIAYETDKYGYRSHGSWGAQTDVMLMVLDGETWDAFNLTEEEQALKDKAEKEAKEAADKEKDSKKDSKKDNKKSKKDEASEKPIEKLDYDNRHYRKTLLTPQSGSVGDFFLSPKGEILYYTVRSAEGKTNLMSNNLKKQEVKVLTENISGGLIPDEKGEHLFALTGSGIKKITLSNGKAETIEFEAQYDRHPSKEREYIYDHMLQQVADKFHDTNMHGCDWEFYGKEYRKFLPHINNNYDFATLLSEILGELNASHTGGRYRPAMSATPIASLGAFFDESYEGDGLKVKEIIARGPLSKSSANVQAGDIINSIDGTPIVAGIDYYPLLEGKDGKKVHMNITKQNGQNVNTTVKPISASTEKNLLYHRWVERNAKTVDSLSNGRVGYVHIQGMDSESFRNIYDKILGKYRNCDAIIVDTRYNGGGWLHNDVVLLLSGKEYVRYTPRGRYIGSDPFSQWTKPSAMIVGECNYSDAHGTPYAYQTLGVGPVVGAPVAGTMTAVWWETQVDPTLVFGIPQVSSLDRNGNVLENQQLNPDILVYNAPAEVIVGEDAQLKAAVNAMLQAIAKAKEDNK